MIKQCCEWHNALPDSYDEPSPPEDNKAFGESPECGLAGMGTPSVCCRECPQAKYFIEQRHMLSSDIDFVKEIMEETSS